MARKHGEQWFRKQEARLLEPFKNTIRYYRWGLLRNLFILPKALYDLARVKYYQSVSLRQSADYLGKARAITFVGAPGVGKTFSGGEFAISVALQQWQKLQSEYLLQSGLVNRWIAEGNVDKVTAYLALEASYWFNKERETQFIPCLASSVPIRDIYGRRSYEYSDAVALQQIRLPEYTVIFNDETGSTQGANTSRNASCDIMDFYRYLRHFGDFMLINTEQGGDGNAKYIRKVTDYNIRLKRQSWIMAPEGAIKRLEKKKKRYFKRRAKGKYSELKAKFLCEKLYYRQEYLKTIGYRCIPYRFEATEGNAMDAEQGEYIFPARGIGTYDSRSYRKLYKCRNQDLDLPGWESLLVPSQDLHRFDDQISG